MSLVTVSGCSIGEYSGTLTPSYAVAFANKKFTESGGVVIAQGSDRDPSFGQRFSASLSGVNIQIASGDIYTTTDSSDPSATYTVVVFDANNTQLLTVFTQLRVPPTPTTTTWNTLRIFSEARTLRDAPSYLSAQGIMALFASWISSAQRASDVLLGVSRLSFAPLNYTDPIAVGDNDPIIRATRKTYYLESYGHTNAGLLAAITAIGSTVAELRVSSLVNVFGSVVLTDTGTEATSTYAPATITIPANILVTFSANGAFTVPTGKTLTFNKRPVVNGLRKVFYGAGDIVIANADEIWLDWWAEPGTVANSSHAVDQVVLSQAAGSHKARAGIGTWKFNAWNLPAYGQIEGSGFWDGNPVKKGTIFEPYQIATDSYMIKMSEAFRGGAISNLCLNPGASAKTIGIILEGTTPNSALAAMVIERISITGGASDGALDQIKIHTLDVGQWECTNVSIQNSLFVTGESGKTFSIDTTNTSISITGNEFLCGTLATAIYLLKTGYTGIKNNQFRGQSGLTDTAVFERDITGACNLTIGSPYLNLASGQFLESDIGKRVTVGAFTTTIKGIVDPLTTAGLANRAHLSNNSSINAVSDDGQIFGFTPDPNAAYCAIHIAGSHTTLNIENNVDEGFAYFIVDAGLQLEYPLNLRGNKPQGRIRINNSCTINSDGNDYLSNQWIDGLPDVQLTRLISHGDTISKTSVNLFNGTPVVSLNIAQLWTNQGITTYTQSADSFFDGLFRSIRELPLHIFDRSTAAVASIPLLSLGTARLITGGVVTAVQPLLQLGRLNVITKKIDYWYQVGYQYSTGILAFWSNVHATHRKYYFDARVYAAGFDTPVDESPLVNANVNNYDIGTPGGVKEIDSTGWFNITGFALPTDPLIAGFDPPSFTGAAFKMLYKGNSGVVLKHENAGSTAANRITCDWGSDINLNPGDWAVAVYRNSRWNVSLLSRPDKIYQLTSDVTYNATDTLANTLLKAPLGPGSYLMEVLVHSESTTRGLKVAFSTTATATLFKGQWGLDVEGTANIALQTSAPGDVFSDAASDTFKSRYMYTGAVTVTVAGTMFVQAAQRLAHASNTKILAGSTIKFTPTMLV